jgi:hypothetical protein
MSESLLIEPDTLPGTDQTEDTTGKIHALLVTSVPSPDEIPQTVTRFGMFHGMADEEVPPDTIDLESLDLGEMASYARTATFASNWKTILATDGSLGLAVFLAGLALVIWVGWVGWILVVLGLIYMGLVVRRFLQWRWIRRKAGLD